MSIRAIRIAVGLFIPIVLAVMTVTAFGVGVDLTWSTVLMAGLLAGPFFLYYLTHKEIEFVLFVGGVLLAVSGWAVYWTLVDASSTAGVNMLWIPLVGYPLVVISALIGRANR